MTSKIFSTAVFLSIAFAASAEDLPTASLLDVMPTEADDTQISWAEGFPHLVPSAPWLRFLETGHYRMAIHTETLAIPEFGPSGQAAALDLRIQTEGTSYRAIASGPWNRHQGPRVIESGPFLQRGDLTNLVFESEEGVRLNTEARLEIVAWPRRLGFVLFAEPGLEAIAPAEDAFGKSGGGYGFTGGNDLVIPHHKKIDPKEFTLEFWGFLPRPESPSTGASPWLVCKNYHEAREGNFGIQLRRGKAVARMNIEGRHEIQSPPLKFERWTKFTLSYTQGTMRFLIDDEEIGSKQIGIERTPGKGDLVFGRRADSPNNPNRFQGILDEIKIFDHSVSTHRPSQSWGFRANGQSASSRSRESWKQPRLSISLKTPDQNYSTHSASSSVALTLDPCSGHQLNPQSDLEVTATTLDKSTPLPVHFEPNFSWYRINLNGLEPTPPNGKSNPSNDAMERAQLVLSNPGPTPRTARLLFEKSRGGIRQRLGSPITGIFACLRDSQGNPTGIPVQISKNWHSSPEAGPHTGTWFHGISLFHLPPYSQISFELSITYGHWGGVAAASHSQLSLIGWGTNQLWYQSAVGAWGESICFEPEQSQARTTITDVRPLMLSPHQRKQKWGWSSNVGGADFFRFFTTEGQRLVPTHRRTTVLSAGPCLTEVRFSGTVGKGIDHTITASLPRTDDLIRATYRIRMDVNQAMDFSRFVIFQIGSDTYNSTREKTFAIGDQNGLQNEWSTHWGGNRYRTQPSEIQSPVAWASLHQVDPTPDDRQGTLANRGWVIRSWQARLGGKSSRPWVAERGLTLHRKDSSTLDILPPPEVTRLIPGDFIEATLEHLVIPANEADYYGPNHALRDALRTHSNHWKMVEREALQNQRSVKTRFGTLQRLYPDVRIETVDNHAEFTLEGGLAYVPITFSGLSRHDNFTLVVDGSELNQSVHGNDFWQTTYDPQTKTWSRTYNFPVDANQTHHFTLHHHPH
ncbi:MAG: LamG-like jellyroll fold domain-containing protein [Verrucomicrobiales bacterium]